LSQIRRPSKSSIVNSSIAHIHASRRHRILASRELRLIKLESDALRREINEWRDRAGIPRIEEPIRGDGFSMVLSGELEVIAAVSGEDDEDGEGQNFSYMDDGEDDYPPPSATSTGPIMDDIEDPRVTAILKGAGGNPFAHNIPPAQQQQGPTPLHLTHILPRPSGGMMASPTSYDGMYDSSTNHSYPQAQGPHFLGHGHVHGHGHAGIEEKLWGAQGPVYHPTQHQQMIQAQRSLFTPPSTSHGNPGATSGPMPSGNGGNVSPGASSPVNAAAFSDQAFFTLRRQQQQMNQQVQGQGQGYVSDDASSVSSAGPGGLSIKPGNGATRERSSSLSGSVASYTGSPPHYGASSPGGGGSGSNGGGSPTYELASHGDFGVPRRGGNWGREGMMDMGIGMGVNVGGMGVGMNGMSMVGVGGGGNGGGFAMMM